MYRIIAYFSIIQFLFNCSKKEQLIDFVPVPEIHSGSLYFERNFGSTEYNIAQNLSIKAGNYFKLIEIGVCYSTKNQKPSISDNRLVAKNKPDSYGNSFFESYKLTSLERGKPYYFSQYLISTTDTIYFEPQKSTIPDFYCDNSISVSAVNETKLESPVKNFIRSYSVTDDARLIFINTSGNLLIFDSNKQKWELNNILSFNFLGSEFETETLFYLKIVSTKNRINAFDFQNKRLLYTDKENPKWKAKAIKNIPDNLDFEIWYKSENDVFFVSKETNSSFTEKSLWCYNFKNEEFTFLKKIDFNNVGYEFIKITQSDEKVYIIAEEYLSKFKQVWEFSPMDGKMIKVFDFNEIFDDFKTGIWYNLDLFYWENGELNLYLLANQFNCLGDLATIRKTPTLKLKIEISSNRITSDFIENKLSDFLSFHAIQGDIYVFNQVDESFILIK